MSTPKVSVIVCTYNQEGTIARAIESILAQQVDFRYEIILADDCSQDSTPQICTDYARRYPDIIRLFLNPKNKGVVDNYFDCIEACSGEYIADLAGDDQWVDPLKLSKQVKIMDDDPGIVLCHAGWRPVYPDGTLADSSCWNISDKPKVSQPDELTLTLLRHEKKRYFIHLCTAMYRRDAINTLLLRYPHLFREKYLTCEDLQINVMMSHIGKIAYIPDIVLHYTIGAPSVSSDENPIKTIRFYSGVITLTSRLAETIGIDKSKLKDYHTDVMQFIIMQYFVNHNIEGKRLIDALLKQEKINLSLKNRLTLFLSSNTLTWHLATRMRKLLK